MTRATAREYIAGVVKRGVSAAGAGIRGVPGKVNSYPYKLGKNVTEFKAGMEKAGVQCELRIYEGQGHSFFNYGIGKNKYYYDTLREADRFLAWLVEWNSATEGEGRRRYAGGSRFRPLPALHRRRLHLPGFAAHRVVLEW